MKILKLFRRLIEFLLHSRIYGYPSSIVQIIPEGKRRQAWFSYPSIIRSIIEDYHVDLILDVGANRGQFALEMRQFYKGPIISFEPISRTFNILRETAPRDKNWFKLNYALGNESGERYMNVYPVDEMNSLLDINEDGARRFEVRAAAPGKELVQLRRFDDIIGELPVALASRRIFLKTDAQGYDLEVFKGFRSVREKVVVLQSEVYQLPVYEGSPFWTESFDVYVKAGFKLVGLFPVTRDGFCLASMDCLMVR